MVDHIKFTTEIAEDWKSALSFVDTEENKHCKKRIRDASTSSQLQSKLWLVSEIANLDINIDSVAILAGWYANFIVPLLVDEIGVKYILNLEIDPDVKTLTYKFNKRHKSNKPSGGQRPFYKAIYECVLHDVMYEPLKYGNHDLVINASCEHMYPMTRFRKLNYGKNYLYALQSTDDEQWDDHINCVSGPDELADQAGIVDLMYSGTIKLNNGMKRFMVIGR
tara:strand:+ start:71 stop:736 length:666 start_codon:yes stop_codon:yes gene_type:complete